MRRRSATPRIQKSSRGFWTAYPPDFLRFVGLYQEVAAEAGRQLRLGESVGRHLRGPFGRTEDEAVALLRETNTPASTTILAALGSGRRSACRRTPTNIRAENAADIRVDGRAHAQS